MDKKQIQKKYEEFARWYDFGEAISEFLAVGRLRKRLLQRASGKVLEIAVGTGKNLPYYPRNCHLTAVDLSPARLQLAQERAMRLKLDVDFLIMDAQALAFPDQSFDTVVDSLSLCTIPDPVVPLREMARVCRRDGQILLVEHGRSSHEWLGRWQDGRADRHAEKFCCRWNLNPLDLVRQAQLLPIRVHRIFLGIFWMLEVGLGAKPVR
ncbi:MAG TPA: class I SAM-dependent methyltransferase [Candidatus Acidoferrales bacterium]|nr:class I SAM-dependent methyltransferase [Candidatus Acidoferrales bacterium]